MATAGYYVYITTNANRTVLYTGVTDNLTRRLDEHRQMRPGTFTSRYGVCRLINFEKLTDIRAAISREKEIKGWRHSKKVRLIEELNPYWKFLDEEL